MEECVKCFQDRLLHCNRLKTNMVCLYVRVFTRSGYWQTGVNSHCERTVTHTPALKHSHQCDTHIKLRMRSLTSISMKLGDGWNKDLMEEKRTAVHLYGPWQKASKIIYIPVKRERENATVVTFMPINVYYICLLCIHFVDITPICGPSPKCWHKVGNTQLTKHICRL